MFLRSVCKPKWSSPQERRIDLLVVLYAEIQKGVPLFNATVIVLINWTEYILAMEGELRLLL